MGRLYVRCERRLLKHAQNQARRVTRGQPLVFSSVLVFVPIGPVANTFDQYPINFLILAGYVKAGALHLTADRLWLETVKLLPKIDIIYKLFPGEDEAKIHFRFPIGPNPIEVRAPKPVK